MVFEHHAAKTYEFIRVLIIDSYPATTVSQLARLRAGSGAELWAPVLAVLLALVEVLVDVRVLRRAAGWGQSGGGESRGNP